LIFYKNKIKNIGKLNEKMEQFTKGKSKIKKEMVMVFRFGEMVRNTKDIGNKIEHEDMENFFMQIRILIKDNGKMIYFMDMEYIEERMVQNIKEFGNMIMKMVRENKFIKMEVIIKDNLEMVKNKDLVNIFFQIIHFIKVNGKMIIWKAMLIY